MDYEVMLQQHEASGADVTVGCIEVPRMEATAFGVMQVDGDDRVVSFLEKPADPPGMPDKPDMALASMGIYVFSTSFLTEQLRRDAADLSSSHDFGSDLVPYIVRNGHAQAHRFTDSCVTTGEEASSYWRDVGTVDAYWQANIDLTSVVPPLDLYDRDWPIWTHSELSPPAKFVFDDAERRGTAVDSLVSGGCIVSGSHVARSVLSTNVRVHSYCRLDSSVLLPGVTVNRHARLTRAVVDSGVRLPEGLVVGEDAEADARRFRRTAAGVTLITQPMIDALTA
jgi:glucose-1-phosphate adenylyltransferase